MNLDTGWFGEAGDPDELRELLVAFLLDQKLLAQNDRLLSDLREVSPDLRAALERAERNGQAWSAWKHRGEVHALSAELDEPRCRTLGRSVLLVFVHNAAGRVVASGSWVETLQGQWLPAHPHIQHQQPVHLARLMRS
jgi:hypothetical protein